MKIIVFGATGGVGKWVLEQGLKAGHEITAFVRTPQKVTITHENLAVVQGDAFDKEAVSAAIAGHEENDRTARNGKKYRRGND